jgi:glycosyltransferase involved in cell wall biosynthesis
MFDKYAALPGGRSRDNPINIVIYSYYESSTLDGLLFKNPNAGIGENLYQPWCELYQYGLLHGLNFFTPDQIQDFETIDLIIFLDRPNPNARYTNQLINLSIPKYLILYETEVIHPMNWDSEYHKIFDKVFTWNDDLVDNVKYFKLNFSIDTANHLFSKSTSDRFHSKRLCSMIAGAKIANHPNELYSKRIEAIAWFDHHAPESFDLFGRNWPETYSQCLKGSVEKKLETLSQYKFSICFENAKNYSGYITEKILDCFLAGTVPVYQGAPNIKRWIPSDCFVDFNEFSNFGELHDFLNCMPWSDYEKYLTAIKSFLTSGDSYLFSIDFMITELTSSIVRDVKKARGTQALMSVVIPTYNHGDYIVETVNSVLNQGIDDLEIIIVDNASTDNTKDIIQKNLTDHRISYFQHKRNIGAARNWRTATGIASGKYLTVLSSDDFFLRGHLSRAIAALESHKNAGLVYCPVICVNDKSTPTHILAHPGHPSVDYCGGRNEAIDLLKFDCYITPSSAVIRREAFEHSGGINQNLAAAIDWDLWIRIAEAGYDFLFFKTPDICYRHHPHQDTSRAVMSGDLFFDHLKILSRWIQKHGVGSLQPYQNEIANLLIWRKYNQGGPHKEEPHAAFDELLNAIRA